jgi:ParB family transcriptional regulator, chromosome partitioning protein
VSKKPALGRGLGALIPSGEADGRTGPLMVAVDAISPNPHQPRGVWNSEQLEELAASIREHGLIQPLIVRRAEDGRYTLIAGERRWRASQMANLTEVPVVVKEATPQAMLEIALIENIQRADLNPLEEALAYQQLMDEFGLTQEAVAQRVGKSRPAVANAVRLLELPDEVKQAVNRGEISGAHARTLAALPTPEMQTAVLRNILKFHWNVRQTEAVVQKMKAGQKPRPRRSEQTPAELAMLESQFRDSLGTRVNIQKGVKGGRVIIHFYSDEELQAIYEAIVKHE